MRSLIWRSRKSSKLRCVARSQSKVSSGISATRLGRSAMMSAVRGTPRSSVPSPNQLPVDRPPRVTERPSGELTHHLSRPSMVPYQCSGVSPQRHSAAPVATSTSRISSSTRSPAATPSCGNQADPCSS